MSEAPLRLTLRPGRLAICRLAPDDPPPAWLFHEEARFFALVRTPEEQSVVCPEDDLPPSVTVADRGWRAFAVAGPLPLTAVGVLATLTAALAAARVPVYAISTHDTDYLLVPDARLAEAAAALATVASVATGP